MGNTVGGSYRTTTQNTMQAFDKLSKSAREALTNAVESWAPQPILTWQTGKRPDSRPARRSSRRLRDRTVMNWLSGRTASSFGWAE
jgi:hypothetical protein